MLFKKESTAEHDAKEARAHERRLKYGNFVVAHHKVNTYHFKYGLPVMLVIEVVVVAFLMQAGAVQAVVGGQPGLVEHR